MIGKLFKGIKNAFTRKGPEFEEKPEVVVESHVVRPLDLDEGPAKQWYVKACFPTGFHTKKLTPAREKKIHEVMRTLRPAQRAIAVYYGYTKGLYK